MQQGKNGLWTTCVGTTGGPYAKDWRGSLTSHHIQKLTQNGSNMWDQMYLGLPLRRRHRDIPSWLWLGNGFLDTTIKAWTTTKKIVLYQNFKNLCFPIK